MSEDPQQIIHMNANAQIQGSSIVIGYPDDSEGETKQYQEYTLSLIRLYEKQAFRDKIIHNILQLTVFIGATAATILISFSKILPAILTSIVTVATALANYYKFGEKSRVAQLIAEDLALEYNKFKTNRGIYKNRFKREALELFMDKVESMIL